MGGSPAGPVDKGQHEVEDWERLADAINGALGAKGLQSTDQHRRAIENLEELAYGLSGLPQRPLYKVGFRQIDLWDAYTGSAEDHLYADLYEQWLEPERGTT